MKPGDLIYPTKKHRDLPRRIYIGIYTGENDQFNRKIILWWNGTTGYLEEYEERYYEVIS